LSNPAKGGKAVAGKGAGKNGLKKLLDEQKDVSSKTLSASMESSVLKKMTDLMKQTKF
jgi:hypothetical protein